MKTTKQTYDKIARQHLKQMHLAGIDSNSVEGVVDYLRSVLPDYRPSTRKMWKVALRHYYQGLGMVAVADAIRQLSVESREEDLPHRSSSRKAKTVRPEAFPIGTPEGDWLMSGWMTGLRPSEWKSHTVESWKDGVCCLDIKNGKASQGRANGESRKLRVEPESHDQENSLRRHIERVNEARVKEGGFEAFYTRVRKALQRRSIKTARGNVVSLYTSRHQFAADHKKILSKVEVAAILGHGSDVTAGVHYAKKRSAGSRRNHVIPALEDVLKVRKKAPEVQFERKSKQDIVPVKS